MARPSPGRSCAGARTTSSPRPPSPGSPSLPPSTSGPRPTRWILVALSLPRFATISRRTSSTGNWQNAPQLDFAPAAEALEELFVRNTWRSWRTWGITGGMVAWSAADGWRGVKSEEGRGPALPAWAGVETPTRPSSRRRASTPLPSRGWGQAARLPRGRCSLDWGPTLAYVARAGPGPSRTNSTPSGPGRRCGSRPSSSTTRGRPSPTGSPGRRG